MDDLVSLMSGAITYDPATTSGIDLSSIFTRADGSAPSGPPRAIFKLLPDPGHILLILDHSGYDKFIRCPQAGYKYLIQRREPAHKGSALTFGGALHEGLEFFYAGAPIDHCEARLMQYFLDHPCDNEWRTPALCLETFRHYRATYIDDTMTMGLDEAGHPIIERAFQLPFETFEINETMHLPLGGEGQALDLTILPTHVTQLHVAWAGKIDMCPIIDNQPWVMDHKTTSITGDSFAQAFRLSSQGLGYLWAARQLFPHLPFAGFIVNAIVTRKPSKSGVGHEEFRTRFDCASEYTDFRMTRWVERTRSTIWRFIQCLLDGDFPEHDAHCFNKYGKCGYHDVCVANSTEAQQNLLSSPLFTNVTWDPTGKEE